MSVFRWGRPPRLRTELKRAFRADARRASAQGLLLFAPLLAGGCEQGHEQQQLTEAGQLSRAIHALRRAPNPAKAERLRELEKLTCSAPALCELKQSCERAYRRHVAALESVRRIEREVGAAERAELGGRLEQTGSELVRAERATQVCVAKQSAVQEQYGLDW